MADGIWFMGRADADRVIDNGPSTINHEPLAISHQP
jgi:hypothetical protein